MTRLRLLKTIETAAIRRKLGSAYRDMGSGRITSCSADDEYARIELGLSEKHAGHVGLEQHGRVKTIERIGC